MKKNDLQPLYYNIAMGCRKENAILEELIYVMQRDFSNIIRDNEKTIVMQAKRIDSLLVKITTLESQLPKDDLITGDTSFTKLEPLGSINDSFELI